jgi:glutaredoxin
MINDPIIQKIINANPNTYVIFYIDTCPYCKSALNLLRKSNVSYKGYDINKIPGGMKRLLNVLKMNANNLNFNISHQTKPIIFYNKNFLGGFNELSKKEKIYGL